MLLYIRKEKTWNKLKGLILGAGKIIIIMVAIINVINSIGTDGSFGNQDSEKSVLSATARAITPVFTLMGIEEDNWPATVGIISGLLAKAVVVGTLDALYSKIDAPQKGATPEAVSVNSNYLGKLCFSRVWFYRAGKSSRQNQYMSPLQAAK